MVLLYDIRPNSFGSRPCRRVCLKNTYKRAISHINPLIIVIIIKKNWNCGWMCNAIIIYPIRLTSRWTDSFHRKIHRKRTAQKWHPFSPPWDGKVDDAIHFSRIRTECSCNWSLYFWTHRWMWSILRGGRTNNNHWFENSHAFMTICVVTAPVKFFPMVSLLCFKKISIFSPLNSKPKNGKI